MKASEHKIRMLMLFLLLILVSGCQSESALSELIIGEIDSKCVIDGSCDIALQDVTTFKWDRVVLFQVGSSGEEVSKALGIKYKESTDLMTGIIFALGSEIVYEERIPYNPEQPSKLQIVIDKQSGTVNCVRYKNVNAVVKGQIDKIDGVLYYSINAKVEPSN